MTDSSSSVPSFWRSASVIALLALLALGAVALVLLPTEHAAHAFGALPYLLLLACPIMHLFMHGGHRQGSNGKEEGGHDHR